MRKLLLVLLLVSAPSSAAARLNANNFGVWLGSDVYVKPDTTALFAFRLAYDYWFAGPFYIGPLFGLGVNGDLLTSDFGLSPSLRFDAGERKEVAIRAAVLPRRASVLSGEGGGGVAFGGLGGLQYVYRLPNGRGLFAALDGTYVSYQSGLEGSAIAVTPSVGFEF
jgi:hypothetical protein